MKIPVPLLSLSLLLTSCLCDPRADPNAEAEAKSNAKSQYGQYGGYAGGGHTPSLAPLSGGYGVPQHHQQHYKPHYKEPEPLYIEEAYPKQNCSVTDEAVRAEICIPDFQTMCEEDGLMSKRLETGEFCYDVTRTECTMKERTDEVEVCSFTYERKEESAKAKTVEVEFKQECKKQMVTVCQPAKYQVPSYTPPPAYGGYGHPHHKPKPEYGVYQQCKEVAQETCFNIPQVVEKEMEVGMGFPEAKRNCTKQTVTIPEITCEDIVESKCQDIPRIVEGPESIERCKVVVGEPKCSEVEMVLPKQICQDIIYGYAEEPAYPEPAYPEQPPYPEPAAYEQPAPYQRSGQSRVYAKRNKRKRL